MLLTITTTREPATDLGYLLHKHPDRLQTFTLASGHAHVFYPEATPTRCTAALMIEIDPIALVRAGRARPAPAELANYVNDRPYAASSMLAVALKEAFRTGLTGRCDARPDLAATAIPLEIRVPSVRCQAGKDLVRRLFEPLGWTVTSTTQPLDPPEWGDSAYHDVTLSGEIVLSQALNHLYVLLPVLDDAKHYWVTTDEIDKLVRAGSGWLNEHPEKRLIVRRYLAHQRSLVEIAEEQDSPAVPLAVQRRAAVLHILRELRVASVGDLGCGDGALMRDLLRDPAFTSIIAADVSSRALELAAKRLRADRVPEGRLTLLQTSLTYRDDRLAGLDAAVLMEVIEHIDPERLEACEHAVFGFAAPRHVVVTTPNAEYNKSYEGLADGTFRHPDHRFEWTRRQFRDWAERTAAAYGYRAEIRGVGDHDPALGAPTQVAVFSKEGTT